MLEGGGAVKSIDLGGCPHETVTLNSLSHIVFWYSCSERIHWASEVASKQRKLLMSRQKTKPVRKLCLFVSLR